MTDSLFIEGGVGDLVLLDDVNEDEIFSTLRTRYSQQLIYTYIGDVLLSVNPFQEIPELYSKEKTKKYTNRFYYENPPHVFALTESMYRHLRTEKQNQCVIISGESGSGKTEASKKIMTYISDVSGDGTEILQVKERLLKSNPVLEAFGNAKTLRNNNSSRFGKYLEIFFDAAGDPIGGKVKTFLLEKSRVVQPAQGERNFHIFYQLLLGLGQSRKDKLKLGDMKDYDLIQSSNVFGRNQDEADASDEQNCLRETLEGLDAVGINAQEQEEMFTIISTILWLGQVRFQDKSDIASVSDLYPIKTAADLLNVDCELLESCFTTREMNAAGREVLYRNHSVQEAEYTRDALSKLMYQRLFSWLVGRINGSMDPGQSSNRALNHIGVLDIYGFEIFEKNSFEQFCINYVNEKLQQVFIDRTIRAEQEEYLQEGIEWTPVEYFNNKVVCKLIEENRKGVIDMLNEACMFPKGDDPLFLEKISNAFRSHEHFAVPEAKLRQREAFIIKHFAGDVTYDSHGFVVKNKDHVWIDLFRLLVSSGLGILAEMFPKTEISERGTKRPSTAGTQFRIEVNELVHTLEQCHPYYIRCIKPNDVKRGNLITDDMFRHQIRYLGLLENVRVRRAGFAFRMGYSDFLLRNKMIAKATWPLYHKSDIEGCVEIMKALGVEDGIGFQKGKTKLFLKQPRTIFTVESVRQKRILEILSKVKASWKGYAQRLAMRQIRASIVLQSNWRCFITKTHFSTVKKAQNVQNQWKSHVLSNNLMNNSSARVVQSIWRLHNQRSLCTALKAAELVQSYWRGYVIRENQRRHVTAIAIQSQWMGRVVRKSLERFRAADLLQKLWRHCVAIRVISENESSALLQRTWKTFEVKRAFDRFHAVKRVQAVWKGFSVRKECKRVMACIRIQRLWKTFLVATTFRHWTASKVIQKTVRGVLTRLWRRRTDASGLVQSRWKGYQDRVWYKQNVSCILIQRAYKTGQLCETAMSCFSSVLLQSLWKGHCARVSMRNLRSLTVLQSIWRGFTVRSHFKTLLNVISLQKNARVFSALLLAQRTRASIVLRKCLRTFLQCRPDLLMKSNCLALINQRKIRRRNTANTHFIGKYLSEDISLNKVMSDGGDKEIRFLDDMTKISRRYGLYPRTILVTERALYDLERKKNGYKVHNRLDVSELQSVSLSFQGDDFIILHFTGFDCFYSLFRKHELMTVTAVIKFEQSRAKLKVEVSDKLRFQAKGGGSREIGFDIDFGLSEGEFKFIKGKKGIDTVQVSRCVPASNMLMKYLNDIRFRVLSVFDQ